MAARPDGRTVDASAPTVHEHALDHDVEVALPVVHLVVAQQNLREPRAVRLHAGIAAIPVHRRRPAEDQAAIAAIQDCGSDVRATRINGNRLLRDTRLEKRRCHPIWRPGFLRSGLEDKPDLHGNDRHPQRVHTGRVRGQHEPEHRAVRLIADRHAAFFSVPLREGVEGETARQRRENAPHLCQHEGVLLHVRAAHSLGQSGTRRLRVHEVVRGLGTIAHGERAVHVQLARPARARNQFVDGDIPKHGAGPSGMPHVALQHAGVGPADAGDRLACGEVHHLVHVHAGVRLAATEDGKIEHRL